MIPLIRQAPEHIKEERLAICNSCDKFLHTTSTCKVCGCFMKLKTAYAKAMCPLKKWDKVEVGAG